MELWTKGANTRFRRKAGRKPRQSRRPSSSGTLTAGCSRPCRRDQKAVVLFFLLPDCPISNAYAPEIKRICADYEPKKITLFVVHADPDVDAERAKKHAKDYGLSCPLLLDPTHLLVKKTGVAMAPEVAVLSPDAKVLYRGRIDDVHVDYGKRRAEPSQRDLSTPSTPSWRARPCRCRRPRSSAVIFPNRSDKQRLRLGVVHARPQAVNLIH